MAIYLLKAVQDTYLSSSGGDSSGGAAAAAVVAAAMVRPPLRTRRLSAAHVLLACNLFLFLYIMLRASGSCDARGHVAFC